MYEYIQYVHINIYICLHTYIHIYICIHTYIGMRVVRSWLVSDLDCQKLLILLKGKNDVC
jgi:hypothetical protein